MEDDIGGETRGDEVAGQFEITFNYYLKFNQRCAYIHLTQFNSLVLLGHKFLKSIFVFDIFDIIFNASN